MRVRVESPGSSHESESSQPENSESSTTLEYDHDNKFNIQYYLSSVYLLITSLCAALLARDRGSLEIKTVRTVKRESQQRQREKTRQLSADDVRTPADDVTGDDVTSEAEEDPLTADPVLSQFQRAMSLPRGYGGRRSSEQESSQYRHHMLKRLVDKVSTWTCLR